MDISDINSDFEEYDHEVQETIRNLTSCSYEDAILVTAAFEPMLADGFNNQTPPEQMAKELVLEDIRARQELLDSENS